MNRSILSLVVLTVGLSIGMSRQAHSQQVNASQLFGHVTRCDHVIDLIVQHGVNNCFNRSTSLLQATPYGAFQIQSTELGDLEIISVNQIENSDSNCGPTFAVVIQNQSTRSVSGFHVSAVAVFGRICPTSPSVTTKMDCIEAGQATEVHLQLPIDALAMGIRNGQPVGYQRLVIAIDSYDELLETDEANNLKAYDAASIAFVATVSEQAVQAVTDVNETVQTQTHSITPQTASPQTIAPVVEAKPDALRSAIKMLDTGSTISAAASQL
ncbi:hypothetical protein CA13_03320 [Planctomycetes bacterium CA13]|uniref:CARDB domain-containing protein n=1 Tax=Novipirellula herctigrandis TaxID=2527986 RepID=A0A5C5YVD3_9BACT|nr:hypothetical protein CA13_03320 [Planctomycetes bacterium CA13]